MVVFNLGYSHPWDRHGPLPTGVDATVDTKRL